MIELMRSYSQAYFGTDKFALYADEIIIGCSLIIGQSRGRPLSATDISEYIGMPRATVLRKLKSLEVEGMIATKRDGRRVEYILVAASDPEVVLHVRKIITKVRKAAITLSKMDG